MCPRYINLVVSTRWVFRNALIHGFMHMDKIVLLVLDEAHHCFCSHPANEIV